MKQKLLIIGFVWPEPKSSAAGSRMMQLISFFKSRDYEISFVSSSVHTSNSFDLGTLGISTAIIELNSSSFDDFILKLKPDVVLFDRFMTEEQYGWRISDHCPNAIKILDTEDLHFLRRARQKAFTSNLDMSAVDIFNETAKREIASIYRCDLSLIISEYEMKLLCDSFKINSDLLFYLPFLYEDVRNVNDHLQYDDRQHFMTIGNFLHEPNYDALLYLKETLWNPIKKALPNAQLHNYGAYTSDKVKQLHNEDQGFYIKGFAKDVDEVMQASKVLLAPLRFGAGLKGKLFDAMRNGLPFVTTSIGAEGITDHQTMIDVNDEAQCFIQQAIDLYSNQSSWTSQQKLGYQILDNRFSKMKFESLFENRLNKLNIDYKNDRKQNYIGQMLQYHTLRSTKYMSKWIELKNQKPVT